MEYRSKFHEYIFDLIFTLRHQFIRSWAKYDGEFYRRRTGQFCRAAYFATPKKPTVHKSKYWKEQRGELIEEKCGRCGRHRIELKEEGSHLTLQHKRQPRWIEFGNVWSNMDPQDQYIKVHRHLDDWLLYLNMVDVCTRCRECACKEDSEILVDRSS